VVRDVRDRRRAVAWATTRSWGPRTREQLEQWLGRVVVLHSDDATSRAWGRISAAARRRGRPRPANDSWIAACCLAHQFSLATFNPKLLGGGMSPMALTWAFASSVAKSSGYILTSANVIMVSGHGHGFSVQKNRALISVLAGQGRSIYAELQ
jgi:hypothetical protein